MDPASPQVELYLPADGSQLSLLSIPHDDIQRIAIRPLKWFRFLMFCICGAQGELSITPEGPPVNYESPSLEPRYYYQPDTENFRFVDPNALNDKLTSSAISDRSGTFQPQIIARDGYCVVTGEPAIDCDAAHLIPKSKNDEYIRRVCELRSPCYTEPLSISNINDVRNGVLLSAILHKKFGRGAVAFLRTPNFAMGPNDIHRADDELLRADHITLQYLIAPDGYDPAVCEMLINYATNAGIPVVPLVSRHGYPVDAQFPTVGNAAQNIPPTLILDFLYGAATYKLWKSESLHDIVEKYREEHFASITPLPRSQPSNYEGRGDPSGNYRPSLRERKARFSRPEDGLAEAMDDLAIIGMIVKGITPQEAARRREKRMQEEELLAQQASQRKVMEWRKTL